MFTCMHCLADTENDSDICDGCVEKANEENCVHRLQCRDIERDLVEAQAAMHRMYAEIMRLLAALRDIRDMGPMTIDDQRWRIAKNALEAGDETVP